MTNTTDLPTLTRPARELFGIDSDLQVPMYATADEHVPPRDPDYVFDKETTLALLAGFLHNRRVMVQRRNGALSRHAAAQPGPDGSLAHRRDAELPGARSRSGRRARALS